MSEIDRAKLKAWATKIVAVVEPDDLFLVEDGFDSTLEDWRRANSQDEGRFTGGAEIATFSAVVVPFLLGFFGDVAKDVAKDAVKKKVGTLLDKLLHRSADADDVARLKGEITTAIAESGLSREDRHVLDEGFEALFGKLGDEARPPQRG